MPAILGLSCAVPSSPLRLDTFETFWHDARAGLGKGCLAMKRLTGVGFFVGLLVLLALVLGREAHAQTYIWNLVTLDEEGDVGLGSSIAVDANGDLMISYRDEIDEENENLKFTICDLSESTNGNCDQADDWSMVTVDETSTTLTSIAVDANGDPMIAYYRFGGGRKFAVCDLSESTNGNCDQATDWSTVTVDSTGGFWPSIAVDANGDPVVSHYDQTNGDLRFAACDLSESTNGNCDQATDWSTETVDATGDVGYWTSIAVNGSGEPVISYYDTTNGDLKFAAASSPPEPVGGVAELPEVGEEDSSARNFIVPAGFMAVGLLALTAGGWYARRRWLER